MYPIYCVVIYPYQKLYSKHVTSFHVGQADTHITGRTRRRTCKDGATQNPSYQKPGKAETLSRDDKNETLPFLVAEWREISRTTHLLKQIKGEGLLQPADKLCPKYNKRHRENMIASRLVTIHPNPGPREEERGRRNTLREGSIDMTGVNNLFYPTRHTRKARKS